MEEAPETTLSLYLNGILFSETGEKLAVVAERRGGDESLYRVGESINNLATVVAIFGNYIVLERNGRPETLSLLHEGEEKPVKRNIVNTSAAANPPDSPLAANSSGGAETEADSGEEGRRPYDYAELRQQLLANPQNVMKFARVAPVIQGGKMVGYRLNPGRDPQLFNELGLEPGDIVTVVNGISVTSPAEMGNVLNQLTTASSLSVVVLRRGQEQLLTLNF